VLQEFVTRLYLSRSDNLLCVRWYCRFQLSYHDVEEVMREWGLMVDHITIFR
jgi:transposase-like protein